MCHQQDLAELLHLRKAKYCSSVSRNRLLHLLGQKSILENRIARFRLKRKILDFNGFEEVKNIKLDKKIK